MNSSRGEIVLVVDDDPDIRELLSFFFTNEGLSVVTASNGKEGVQRFREAKPSIVVMDVHMPVMNGLVAADAIRKIDDRARIYICSASPIEKMENIETLQKPFSLNDLLQITRENNTRVYN